MAPKVSMTVQMNTDRPIPTIGLGVYLLPLDKTAEIVETALNIGYRHFDSARLYGNEEETAEGIANFLEKNPNVFRSDIFYTTKIWPSDFGYDKTMAAVKDSYDLVKKSIGYIDLILLHTPESTTQKRLESYRALQDAVEQGIVKNIGVSNYGVAHLKELLAYPELKYKPVVNQIEINPWLQHVDITQFCKNNDILIQAYSPLMFGGRLRDPQIVKLADKYKKTPAQILIRWNLQKGFIPLPKSVHAHRILENFTVFDFEISDQDVEDLGDKTSHYYGSPGSDPTKAP
ncbi:aldo-keto reductase superfamily protein [Sugiyamaella lignohabitans]|uniref:Aldo-keto reductase superfamily protein n=1 Tax=Sugiyamaella lignohabitans TaxID=796027 RepID=A0A167FWN9_9ASCO|nr:aldo-keto reductase superfamily protein [Sugiyamaella lignohabitans]ANB15795.1 aldo-keto reductase superfamily protein [Sugiyamaella lignohabitans]